MIVKYSWLILIVAGLFETMWVYFLKKSDGFSVFSASVLFIITGAISMYLLSLSMKSLPMSIAYPVWTGIGAVGSVLIGIILFKESVNIPLAISLTLLIAGIAGIKVFS